MGFKGHPQIISNYQLQEEMGVEMGRGKQLPSHLRPLVSTLFHLFHIFVWGKEIV